MIAVDTNILVYSHRKDSPWHTASFSFLGELAQDSRTWAIPWPCVHEFISVVTHPRIYNPPSSIEQAVRQVEAWLESPTLMMLGETSEYWDHFRPIVTAARCSGGMTHDARVAALCSSHNVSELWTADRDFSRFPQVKVRNPLVNKSG